MNLRHRLLLLLSLLPPALTGRAQTVIWTGQGNLATFGDWNNPANWDTGAVPNGPAFTAVINQVTPAYRNYPDGPYVNANPAVPASIVGGALPIITGAVTLGTLRYDLPPAGGPYVAAAYIGQPGGSSPGSLRLDGAGLDFRLSSGSSHLTELNVAAGSSLTLANQARATRTGFYTASIYLSESAATAASPARLLLQDDAALNTDGVRWLTVYSRGAAAIVFQDRARAGLANFQLGSQATVEFHNTASADQAFIRLGSDSLLIFDGDSTAGTSTISLSGASFTPNSTIVRFAGRSSAGASNISSDNWQRGAVEFTEQATGGTASLGTLRRLDISGAVTAGGATGRMRAGASGLAPASVVATDARTIALGNINATDVLLGSNTLELGGGYIYNLRDSGGAYLSAAGENLTGGGLVKVGPGTLYVYGPSYGFDPESGSYQPSYNVISGPTVVRGGGLYLSNRLTNVTVEAAGTLQGGGFIDGRLVNHGRVTSAPLTVNGDFVQSAGGTFAPYIAYYTPGYPQPAGLTVTGNASLAGTLSASMHPNLFANWAPGVIEIPVLSAGAITGRFGSFDASSNPTRIRVEPIYAATSLKLRFEMLPFTALGATPGAKAFGAYLDRVYQHTSYFFPNNYNWIGDALTFATDGARVAQTMADLGPDRYGTVLAHGFTTALARRPALDRLAGGNEAAVAPSRGALFAEGFRRRLAYPAVDGLPRGETSTTGWLAGGRTRWDAWTAGVYVASEQTDLGQAGGGARIRSVEPGAFLRFDRGGWFAHASASHSQDRHELSRVSNFMAGFNVETLHTARPSGRRTDLGLTAGRTWRGAGWSLSPFAGAVVSQWRLDSFTETSDRPGFPYDTLAIEGWSHTSRRARAGVEAAGSWWRGRVQPRLTAAWWHEFEPDRSIPARFAGATAGYAAPGRPADLNIWQAALEIAVRLRARAWLTAGTSLQQGDHSRTSSDFTAGLRWEF